MKLVLSSTLCLLLSVTTFAAFYAFAAGFSPTPLILTAPETVIYDFDGIDLSIPVNVSGSNASVIFCVFTRDNARNIREVTNGHLGWHYVNRVDTCVYASTAYTFRTGNNTVVWNGRSTDGGAISPGTYTYYLWGYDNTSPKTEVCSFIRPDNTGVEILERDSKGLPLSNPGLYTALARWRIGSDPYNEAVVQTSSILVKEGWYLGKTASIDPHDNNCFYVMIDNFTSNIAQLVKYRWVPVGMSDPDVDFGDGGYTETFTSWSGDEPGVVTDGDYLYTGSCSYTASGYDDASFVVFDYDGDLVDKIDLSDWWSSMDDFDSGGQKNGGPNSYSERNGKVFLNCHCSCIKQMVDPVGYLDGNGDFFVWTNHNGDYVFDKNFDQLTNRPWICNDINKPPYPSMLDADDNLFSIGPAYGAGSVSFGLLAPDGTGLGYHAFSGETSGVKVGTLFIDSGTAYDGIYCDNESDVYGWSVYGTWYIAHDSISGVIDKSVSVDEASVPRAFKLEGNHPNPFNPATVISFTIQEESCVTLTIYDISGRTVAVVADSVMPAGSHEVTWDATDHASGVYFYRLKAGGFSRTMKMTLLK